MKTRLAAAHAPPLPKLHPVVERLREILGPEISTSSIHHWIQLGLLTTVKIGKKRYVTDENLRAFLAHHGVAV